MHKKNNFSKPELNTEDLSLALYNVTQKLEQTNSILQKTQQQKDLLFANISHDLRSPITAIRNSIEYLLSLENIEKEELIFTLKLMERRSIYLETLINDVFLLSSIQVNNNMFHYETLDLAFLLEDFFFTVSEDSRYDDRNLFLDVPEDFNAFVRVDSKMFLRVLDNLFSNALKYSQKGASIRLNAFLEHSQVHVTLEDTGIGIEQEYLDKIFETSYMIESARTPSSTTGTGLGLSIVKAIIEQFQGKIWCESTVGVGSTFHFLLPLAHPTSFETV